MKELNFVQACPDDNYYVWQVHMWLESLKEIGHSDKAVSLIFTPKGREQNPKWEQIQNLYPESKFIFYKDEHNISNYIRIYIPVLRPYVLQRFYKDFPEMTSKAIFYCDSDILFTPEFNIEHLLEDDINYLSDTNSYINSDYFDNKIKQVLPEKLEEYKKRDILAELTSLIGIDRETAEKFKEHSGGAQYLLKNLDSAFWNKVMNDCIIIRTYLFNINKEFFKDESSGFQSWCADMWAVLWNLWLKNRETKVVKELDFAWSSDPIERLSSTTILHNAGIVSKNMGTYQAFYKGQYHLGSDPTEDPHLEVVLKDEQTMKKCNWYYANKLKQLKEKYKLKY